MQVGIIIGEASPLTWDRWRHIVALVERLGFHSLFRSDHYFNGTQKDAIDPYLSFVAAALESRTIRFGPLVSPVTFREPVNVGRMAQQLDALSHGRFVLGLGVGWFEAEHTTYGLDYPPLAERYQRLDDALELMKVLWYDPAEIRRSMLQFTDLAPNRRLREVVGDRIVNMIAHGSGMKVADFGPRVFTGSVDELVDALGRRAQAGLQEVVFEHFVTELDDVPQWLAEEVAPQIRAL